MKGTIRGVVFLLFALTCSQAQAQVEGNPANWCRNGPFAAEETEYRLARVVGRKGARVYFYGDDGENCPSEKCRQKAYVVPGDEVIVSRTFGDWVCAWYQPARGSETVGWLKAHELSVGGPERGLPLASWEGEWTAWDNSLSLRRDGRTGQLSVTGDAVWKGANPGQVHVGTFGAKAAPEGNVLRLEEDECRVTLRLVGRYLLAGDNKRCGGFNVTFDGVYRRKPARTKKR